jgi:hypothetical protein
MELVTLPQWVPGGACLGTEQGSGDGGPEPEAEQAEAGEEEGGAQPWDTPRAKSEEPIRR